MNAVAEVVDNFLEAVTRRNRKPKDADPLYANLQKELRLGWNELAQDLRREWSRAGIANTFEAKRRGPSARQTEALYNRAKRRADKRHAKAIDRNSEKAMTRGAASAMKDVQVGAGFGISFDLDHPDAVDFLRNRGAERVKGISGSSRERIKNLVVRMAEEGASYGEIGRAIDQQVKGWSSRGVGHIVSRGEMIAVTEVGQAYEAGRQAVAKDMIKAGVDMEKSWLTVGDPRVCQICEPAEADGWISYQDQYSNGMDHPLGHPGCRCDESLQAKT